jgi:hemoglobin
MNDVPSHHESAVTRDDLRELVVRFYGVIREDDRLGPIFNARVRDWDAHLDKMTRFWSSAMLREGSYHGNPIAAHRFEGLSSELFDHWLALFEHTALEVLGEQGMREIMLLARRMGRTIAMRTGVRSALD